MFEIRDFSATDRS